MSFIIGKVTRKVSKQHNEYFVGKVSIKSVEYKQDGVTEIVFIKK